VPLHRLRVVAGGKGRALTVRAVAGLLGCSTATVYKLCAAGELGSFRILNAIRIQPEAVEAFIEAHQGKVK
jgi:excisionase family DNA binding protein